MKQLITALAFGAMHAAAAAQGGGEFLDQKVGKLATSEADFLCDRLYDSANPVGMLAELAVIVGPRVLLQQVPDLSGISPQENKELFDKLRTLARRKIWLPVSGETQIGRWMNDKVEKEGLVIPAARLNARDRARFAEIQATLDAVVATLPADNPYQFKLQVVQGDQSNASIAVGGYVYVNLGLLRDRTLGKDDIALRLSHEVAHLTRRHALKDIQLKVVDAMAVSKDIKGMLSIATDPVKTVQSVLGTASGTMLLFQRFDQNQELEGDACGMQLLVRTAGVDARQALANYIARKPLATPESWDKSHPAAEEREFVMKTQLDPQQLAAARAKNKSGSVAAGKPAAGGTGSSLAPDAKGGSESKGGLKGVLDSIKKALPAGASAPAGAETSNNVGG